LAACYAEGQPKKRININGLRVKGSGTVFILFSLVNIRDSWLFALLQILVLLYVATPF